ncbi:MAG: DNA (cytosine-5-)-methyltransferase, partial [Candidatus Latescibacterota bacterium]|nr:DNA (cytosine-5-)-methyltransferase [Candidatus Latescibacterota bacterium]
HDILCAGFPCQPFSLAGVSKKNSLGRKHGFDDETQGTLFHDIVEIVKAKRPKAIFLENVKNLQSHDKGQTFRIISETLKELGYVFNKKVVDGKNWVPQHRERIFIVGYDKYRFDLNEEDIFIPSKPINNTTPIKLKDIIEENVDTCYTIGPGTWNTLKRHKAHHAKAGNGFGYSLHKWPIMEEAVTRTISARYHKDGAEVLIDQPSRSRPRKLTVKEAMQLQGFDPERFDLEKVSLTQAYRQIGNSVVVLAVQDVAKTIVDVLLKRE